MLIATLLAREIYQIFSKVSETQIRLETSGGTPIDRKAAKDLLHDFLPRLKTGMDTLCVHARWSQAGSNLFDNMESLLATGPLRRC